MERLTEHHVNKTLGAYMVCSGACIKEDFDCTLCENLNKIVNTLAAYEDTGLEPEEITTEPYGCVFYCNRKCNLDGDFCAEGPGCPHEINAETAKHLLELAQAEKDGRLMVLPVKEGAKIYRVRFNFDGNCYEIIEKDFDLGRFRPEDFGRIIFRTREEAEATLKIGLLKWREKADNEAD